MSTNVIRGQRAKTMAYWEDITFDTETLNKILEPLTKKSITTGCPLCDEIWSSAERYRLFSDEDEEYYEAAIVMEDGKPWLYILGEDWYVMQINFCPKCGRKLVEE